MSQTLAPTEANQCQIAYPDTAIAAVPGKHSWGAIQDPCIIDSSLYLLSEEEIHDFFPAHSGSDVHPGVLFGQ